MATLLSIEICRFGIRSVSACRSTVIEPHIPCRRQLQQYAYAAQHGNLTDAWGKNIRTGCLTSSYVLNRWKEPEFTALLCLAYNFTLSQVMSQEPLVELVGAFCTAKICRVAPRPQHSTAPAGALSSSISRLELNSH